MSNNCSCKSKCGNAKITIVEDTVRKGEPFDITIEFYTKNLDVGNNKLEKVPYTPDPQKPLTISALSDGHKIEITTSAPIYNGNTVTYSGCTITSDPPNNAFSTDVTISVMDKNPPSEGKCGAANITLTNYCQARVIAAETVHIENNPVWDLSSFSGSGIGCPGAMWRLIEVGMCTFYNDGEVDQQGKLVGLPTQFTSNFDYDGYMELQLGCYQEDEERWVWPGECAGW